MGRTLRRAKNRREPLSEAWRYFFETGDDFGPKDGGSHWGVALEWIRHESMWREHAEDFLAEWIEEAPGCRPWGWWRWAATEARAVVRGAELLKPKSAPTDWDWRWKAYFGVPAFVQCRPRGYVSLPAVESEANYLDRLCLLSAKERAALPDDAFDPEDIDPFHADEEELERLLDRRR